MLDHLLDANAADFLPDVMVDASSFVDTQAVTPAQHASARIETANWLKDLGAEDDTQVASSAERRAAAEAFAALTTNAPDSSAHALITRLDTPPAVQHLVGMLTAYDWEFVERAKELRGYAVAKIMEETSHPDAKIRLRALELLGKVTEVALFTERVEVKKTDISDAELDRKIDEKMKALAQMSDAEVLSETPRADPPQADGQ